MNHIKSINEFFGLFSKKKRESPIKISIDTLRDLISDDLDNFKYELYDCRYQSKSDKPYDTEPMVRKKAVSPIHLNKFVTGVDIVGDGPGRRDTRNVTWKYDYKKGIFLYVNSDDYYSGVLPLTSSQHHELKSKTLNDITKSLNKERLNSFGIDFKIVESYVPLILR